MEVKSRVDAVELESIDQCIRIHSTSPPSFSLLYSASDLAGD